MGRFGLNPAAGIDDFVRPEGKDGGSSGRHDAAQPCWVWALKIFSACILLDRYPRAASVQTLLIILIACNYCTYLYLLQMILQIMALFLNFIYQYTACRN